MYSIKDENRFWSKVETGDEDKCWEVVAMYLNRDGYGDFFVNREDILAHRFSYQLHHNRLIQDNMCICHKCDNPACVNPRHLFEGTIQDNNTDKMNKGRSVKGEKIHNSKLTEKQVKEIRDKYQNGGTSHEKLAKEYSVAHSLITNIINRKIWKHI